MVAEAAGHGAVVRRRFLARLGGVVASLAVVSRAEAASAPPASASAGRVKAFRLSSRRSPGRVCRACRAHNANRFYVSEQAAGNDRPHPHCDCRVVAHRLDVATWNRYFRGGQRPVFDLRSSPQEVRRTG